MNVLQGQASAQMEGGLDVDTTKVTSGTWICSKKAFQDFAEEGT